MKRGTPLKRVAFKKRRPDGPTAERERHPIAYSRRPEGSPRAVMGGSLTASAPKTQAYRDAALLDMARDRPCLLLVPGVCNHRLDTTVACHSNLSIHGKAGARKADDVYSVWGCYACHTWLDTDRHAPAALKERVFMEALQRQAVAWRQVEAAADESERHRRAAFRALQHMRGSYAP